MMMRRQIWRRRRLDRWRQHPSIRIRDLLPIKADLLRIQHPRVTHPFQAIVSMKQHLRTIRRETRATGTFEAELAPREQGRVGFVVRAGDVVGDRVCDVVAWRRKAVAAEEEHVLAPVLAQVRRLDERAVAVVAVEDLDGSALRAHAVGGHRL